MTEPNTELQPDADSVVWEKQFDQTTRLVKLELAGATCMWRFAHGFFSDSIMFQPLNVEVLIIEGRRRSVTVGGPRILKSGERGRRRAESYYLTTRDDQHMPEWLKRLVAEVSS